MVTGRGYTDRTLSGKEIREICAESLIRHFSNGPKILFIIPDQTRTAPMDIIFRAVYETLAPRVPWIDFLIALGTHPPMSDAKIHARVGITAEESRTVYKKARFFNHQWSNPEELVHIGTLKGDDISELSHGLMQADVAVYINKRIMEYDQLWIIGPTFPHEVVGFSGGRKYLFPGIAGAEIINMFHWLGALITSNKIIGIADTPVRKIIDYAVELLPMPVFCLDMVVSGKDLAGLYAGPSDAAWLEAARLSEKLHIIYKDHSFTSVLSCAPKMYDDLWTGAKCMYKLEPVVADGGELIIYAPHISEVSFTHGHKIMEIGYHVRDYYVRQWDRFMHIPGGVMAHSTHVRGSGTFENGVECPRIQVSLATSIPESLCRTINLGYRNPETLDTEKWMNRENEGILYVPKAGEILYRLRS